MTDGKFRERRSAFSDETGLGAEIPSEVRETPPEPIRDEVVSRDPVDHIELPEPSFLEIVQYLALQAMQFMGDVPIGADGERRVLPDQAKHFIDLLEILHHRTEGNLSDAEAQILEQILADLQVRFLQLSP
jgi:hypothetical protein